MLTFADSLAATKQQDTTEEIRAKKKQEQQSPTTPPYFTPYFLQCFYSHIYPLFNKVFKYISYYSCVLENI